LIYIWIIFENITVLGNFFLRLKECRDCGQERKAVGQVKSPEQEKWFNAAGEITGNI